MYIQSLRNFSDIDHDQIGDPNEGLSYSLTKDVKVEVNGEIIEVAGPVRIIETTEYNPFIFCMYSLNLESSKVIDRRCCGFGDYALIIKDEDKLTERIAYNFERNFIGELKAGHINYVDSESYNGDMGAFRKYTKYDYQREYRYVLEVSNYNPGAIKFYIGNLSDIAVLCPSEMLGKYIESMA